MIVLQARDARKEPAMTAQALTNRPMTGFNDTGRDGQGTSSGALRRTAQGLDRNLLSNLQTVTDTPSRANPAGRPDVADLQLMVAILRGTLEELSLRGESLETPGLDLLDSVLSS
jgi:hypothetical protein